MQNALLFRRAFSSEHSTLFQQKGLPIGNLTSQLFANIYLNEFDQFMKHEMNIRWYGRYTDDFVIVSNDEIYLQNLLTPIAAFLSEKLELNLHPKKVTIRKFYQGIDFLGYVLRPYHRVLRTKTKRRIFKKLHKRVVEFRTGSIKQETMEHVLQSYLGVLSYANTYRQRQELLNQFWFWLRE